MRTLVTVLCLAATALAGQYNERIYIGTNNGTEPCLAFKTCTTDQARWSLPYPVCGEGRCERGSDGVVKERIVYCPFPKLNDQCQMVTKGQMSFGAFPDCCPKFECPAGTELIYPENDDELLLMSVDSVRANAQQYFCPDIFDVQDPTLPEVAGAPLSQSALTEPKSQPPLPADYPKLVVYT
ncbi:uncharacterized protein LOC143040913 [Oratosquilla oratoria]|uniref:uncharacterized protein LOC143040913 n=1 Tax=Oratosquilla oratoria TaxID=337810 RepID=UPI003F765303